MFNHNSGYSLSDIAAVAGNNGRGSGSGWGDDYWWIILIFLFAGWGNNGWGNGNNGGGSAGTARDAISYSFDFNGLDNGIRSLQSGLCDGFYAMNTGMLNGFSGVQSALCQGFSGVNQAITNSNYETLAAIHADTVADLQNTNTIMTGINGLGTQLASCCCNLEAGLQKSFCDLNYNLATQGCDTRRAISDSTRDIIDSNNAGVRAILDFLTQDKIAELTAENQSLKFAASQAAQNTFITANQEAQTAEIIRRLGRDCPVPAYVVPNPNCCYGSYNLNSCGGCGCGYNFA